MPSLTLLAAHTTAAAKLQHVSFGLFLNLGICILAGLLIVRFWRALKQVSDFMPWVASLLAGLMIMSYWTYNRTEPRILTPLVDKLTLLLPTKAKHAEDLARWRQSRE